VTSHQLVKNDPQVQQHYQSFVNSLTPEQEQRLNSQYEHSVQNFGETRPFEQWKEISGLPAYFRGYAFQQWPEDFNERAYTPEQRAKFDQMLQYLKGE
jgi:Spy/CpxP family protein refolding chaperone